MFYLCFGIVSDGRQNIFLCKNKTLHISYCPHVSCSSAEKHNLASVKFKPFSGGLYRSSGLKSIATPPGRGVRLLQGTQHQHSVKFPRQFTGTHLYTCGWRDGERHLREKSVFFFNTTQTLAGRRCRDSCKVSKALDWSESQTKQKSALKN